MSWLRAFGIPEEVFWQEDWGQEFGGDNPTKLKRLDEKYYRVFGAILGREPKGRKGYQGRVERSHRTDDEEFLKLAGSWMFWYNTGRPHFGDNMNGKTPFQKLKECGYNLPDEFCAFPPVILDKISTNLPVGRQVLPLIFLKGVVTISWPLTKNISLSWYKCRIFFPLLI